jgi:hypothetical protein
MYFSNPNLGGNASNHAFKVGRNSSGYFAGKCASNNSRLYRLRASHKRGSTVTTPLGIANLSVLIKANDLQGDIQIVEARLLVANY